MAFGDEYILLLPVKYQQSGFLVRISLALFVLTVLLCILFITSFYTHPKVIRPLPMMPRNSCPNVIYDYDMLALRWTPTLCFKKGECIANTEKWEIHGLWPTYFNGSWPENCCKQYPFDLKQIKPILVPLEQNWPNQYPGQSEDSLWIHEWNKHGTCSRIGRNKGVLGYFNTTLNFFDEFPIQKWLNEANIIPTIVSSESAYDLQKVKQVIESQIKHKTNIVCRKIKQLSVSLIDTLYICSNSTNSELIDCPQGDQCKSKVILPKMNDTHNRRRIHES